MKLKKTGADGSNGRWKASKSVFDLMLKTAIDCIVSAVHCLRVEGVIAANCRSIVTP